MPQQTPPRQAYIRDELSLVTQEDPFAPVQVGGQHPPLQAVLDSEWYLKKDVALGHNMALIGLQELLKFPEVQSAPVKHIHVGHEEPQERYQDGEARV